MVKRVMLSVLPRHGLVFVYAGTQIHRDELLELKTFLTSTTTRKAKLLKRRRVSVSRPVKEQKHFIDPVW